MNSFEYLCIYCLNAFRGERSTSAIYHLLKGKKSSQTIQDANLFSVGFLFGLFPGLNRDALQETVENLKERNVVEETSEDHYLLTPKGKNSLFHASDEFTFSPHLNGWLYKDKSKLFWRRYSLLVQTISNIAQKEHSFIPVQYEESAQRAVKNYLIGQKRLKEQLLTELYHETFQLLQHVSENQAIIFVSQLSGYQHTGQTLEQVAKKVDMDVFWTRVEFISVIHYILQQVKLNASEYPCLHRLCIDFLQRPQLTETTQKSLKLLNQGFSLEEIAQVRRLRMSTIEDHLVELSLQVKDFSIRPYVNREQEEEIQAVIRQLHTHQLRVIKNHLKNKDISYFQIRLVLTRMGENNES
jgi:uncharacterized protein YpbB